MVTSIRKTDWTNDGALQEVKLGLPHASHCLNANCPSKACGRLKDLINHELMCETKAARGCSKCEEYWYLVGLHAKQCKNPECDVARCHELRPVPLPKKSSLLQSALSLIIGKSRSSSFIEANNSLKNEGPMQLGKADSDDDDEDDDD